MKTKIFSLIVALFAFAGTAIADDYDSVDLIIYSGRLSDDYVTQRTYYLDPSGGEKEKVYDYPVTWAEVKEARFSSLSLYYYIKYIKFHYKIYSTSPNGQISNGEWHTDEWRNSWRILYNKKLYLFPPDQDWVNMETKKTIEFYYEVEDVWNNYFLFNNGGNNYKVTYNRDEEMLRVKHHEAEMHMIYTKETDGENHYDDVYFSTDDGTLTQTRDLGEIHSLKLRPFSLSFYYKDSEALQDVSIQYRVYEEGHADESIWNRMDMEFSEKDETQKMARYTAASKGSGIDVTEGLECNKSYIFEMYYDVVQDGVHYVIGSTERGVGSKIKFVRKEKPLFKSVSLGYSINGGDPEIVMLPPSGYPVTVINEPLYSFQIYSSEIMAGDTIQSLTMSVKWHENDSDDPMNDDMPYGTWGFENSFTGYGFGIWVNEIDKPQNLIQPHWREEKKRVTVWINFEGYDANGNVFYYNNGGKNYMFTWICTEEDESNKTSPEGLKGFVLTINVNGEVIPIEIPYHEELGEDIEVPFKLNMFKVLKAEVETDKPMKNVSFNSKLYDSGKPNSVDWETLELAKSGNTWTAEYPYGKELIPDEWLGKNYTKVYEFFVSAENEEGNTVYLNNLGLNYRIIFPVDDADGILAPSDTPEAGWDIYGTDGRKRNATQRGINILRQSDGTTRKVMAK